MHLLNHDDDNDDDHHHNNNNHHNNNSSNNNNNHPWGIASVRSPTICAKPYNWVWGFLWAYCPGPTAYLCPPSGLRGLILISAVGIATGTFTLKGHLCAAVLCSQLLGWKGSCDPFKVQHLRW